MNLFLPRQPFAFDCTLAPNEAAVRLHMALNPPPDHNPPRWRVRGQASPEGVYLFFSWRRWSNVLAPHLYARWEHEGGRTRLVGEFRQRHPIAAAVLWSGVTLTVALAVMSVRHGLPWSWTLVGGAALIAYPRVSWIIADQHMARIEEFLRATLEAAPDAR